jgi:hypothetical protein
MISSTSLGGGWEGDQVAHHRFIPATLEILILDPAPAGPGQKGGEEADDQEVIDDLMRAVKDLKPKNKQGKSYKVQSVKQR